MKNIQVDHEYFVRNEERRSSRPDRRHNQVPVGYDIRSGYERRRAVDRRKDHDQAHIPDELRAKLEKLLGIDILKGNKG